MANITYKFNAIPDEFFTDEFIDDPIMMRLIRWIFRNISHSSKTVKLKGQQISLDPCEFIFGRQKCSNEAHISPKQVQLRIDRLVDQSFLQKTVRKKISLFTVYKVLTGNFAQISGQTKDQIKDQTCGQLLIINNKKKEDKEDHHPLTPSSNPALVGDDVMTDDLSFNPNRLANELNTLSSSKDNLAHNIYYQDPNQEQSNLPTPDTPLEKPKPSTQPSCVPSTPAKPRKAKPKPEPANKAQVYPGVFLTQSDLEQCIAIKGSLDRVRDAIEYIMRSPGRKCHIYNWPQTLATWQIKSDIKPRLLEHEEMAKRLEAQHQSSQTWKCELYFDKNRDQKGLLFYCAIGQGADTVFIPFIDPEFKEKASKVLRDKRMQQGRISPTYKNTREMALVG